MSAIVYTPLIWLPLGASIVSIALLFYSRRFGNLPEIKYFRLLILLTAAWAAMEAVDMMLTTLDEKILMTKAMFAIMPFVSVAVFCLLVAHCRKERWLTRRNLLLLCAVPIVTVIMAFFMQEQNLFLYDFNLYNAGSTYVLESKSGPMFLLYLLYAYGLIAAGVLLLIDSTRGANPLFKRQTAVFIFAISLPAVLDILDNLGMLPFNELYLPPTSFAISGLIAGWGIYRYRILDIRPMARSEVVEHMTDVLVVADPDGRIIDYNLAAAKLLKPDRSLGALVTEALPLGEQFAARFDLEASFRSEVTLGENERRTYAASVMPVTIQNEDRARIVLLQDITDLKQMEEALRAANARLSLLSSVVRHDLLNKLTAMDGYIALARMEDVPNDVKLYLSHMDKASSATRALVAFARDYEGMGVKAPSWLPVDELFSRAAHQLNLDGINVSSSARGLRIYGDAMVEKVFYNLLDNSMRHGGAITTIHLSCEDHGDHLLLVYTDDGVGVPPSDKEHIFERGFGKNTGLGLFLAREVLMLTNIQIAERGTNGARFEITVPRGAYRFDA